MRLLIFILLLCPFLAFTQSAPLYGTAVGYVNGTPTFTPNTAQKGSELCVSINNKMLYLWNRDSSEWKPLGGITVSFGVPSTTPAAAGGTRTAINMQTGLIYWWNGIVWKEIIAYSVELAGTNLIDSLARSGWVSTADLADGAVTWVKLAQAVKDSINAGGSGGSPTGAAGGDLTGTYPNPTIGNDKIISAYVLDGTLVNADLANQTVDSNKIKNGAITNVKIVTNAVDSTKAADLSPNDLAQTGASTGQVLTWTGSKYAPRDASGSSGTAYTSFQYILDTIPGTGITANEFVVNYEPSKVDSVRLKFSANQKAGQRGGWLANGTSGDSIAVSVPFGVVIGDSQAEGHPLLHSRLHPNGVATFSYNYPDSTGQLSYHLTRLTKFPWVNHGLGSQLSENVVKRFDRDVLGLTSNPADGRGSKTLNRKPIACVVIVGINDAFTAGYTPDRTKANLAAIARKASLNGIYCIMLTLPGDSIISQTAPVKFIEEVNGWLRGGALNQYGTIICDYEKWWKAPAWNDLLHPRTDGLIYDDIHPNKVGYDSLANFIFRETKLPVLHSVILHSENAQVAALPGFSRVTSVRVNGVNTYPLTAQMDSFLVTSPIFFRDSAWYTIMASTSLTGTTYTGFNHIRYVLKNGIVPRINQRTRTQPPNSWMEIQGSSSSATNWSFRIKNILGVESLVVTDDGSVYNKGKNAVGTNTFFGQETAQGNVSGGGNAGFGQYAMFALTSGSSNTAFGERAVFAVTTGGQNAGFGNRAVGKVTTGSNNVGVGGNAVGATTGSTNTGVGFSVLSGLTSGGENVGVGESALNALTTGLKNTSVGTLSLYKAATGASENTAVGYRAGFEATSPTRSSFFGYHAGYFLSDGTTPFTTMTNSMYYGPLTKGSANGVTNENVIGYNATGNGSNTVTLGDANIVSTYIRAGRIYAGTTTIAPFKFTSGTNLTTAEAGAVEYDGTDFYGTDATRREKFIRGYKGTGTPEGSVAAPVGSIYQNSAGGAGTTFYVKQSGTGNTGWAAVGVAANLGYTTDASTGTVSNTGGTSATIPAATDLIAGLLTASDYVALQALKNTRVGLASGTTDGLGDLVITFSSALPNATYSIVITPEGTTSMEYSITAKTTTTATVRFYGSTTGLALASTAVTVNYNAKDY